MLQKNKKNTSVTLTLRHSFQNQRKHALKKVENTLQLVHWHAVKWDTMRLIKVQAGAENNSVNVQGLITGRVT